MAFISLHAKLQFPRIIVVDVRAVTVNIRVGLMLPPYDSKYEAWSSAREGSLKCCEISIDKEYR